MGARGTPFPDKANGPSCGFFVGGGEERRRDRRPASGGKGGKKEGFSVGQNGRLSKEKRAILRKKKKGRHQDASSRGEGDRGLKRKGGKQVSLGKRGGTTTVPVGPVTVNSFPVQSGKGKKKKRERGPRLLNSDRGGKKGGKESTVLRHKRGGGLWAARKKKKKKGQTRWPL